MRIRFRRSAAGVSSLGSVITMFLVGVLFSLAACTPSPYDLAAKSARDAEKRGDLETAAREWAGACKLNPNEREACEKTEELYRRLRPERVARANVHCTEGALGPCMAELGVLLEIRRDDVGVNDLVSAALAKNEAKCRKLWTNDLDDRLRSLKCLYSGAALARRAVDYRHDREAFARELLKGITAESIASAYVRSKTASCVSMRTSPVAYSDKLEGIARNYYSVSVQPNIRGYPPGQLCRMVQEKLGSRIGCSDEEANGFGVRPIAIAGGTGLGAIDHRVSSTEKSIRYKAGTVTVRNPAYEQALDDYDLAKQRLNDAYRALRNARCPAGGTSCSAQTSAQWDVETRERDLRSSGALARELPKTVEKDVYKDAFYIEESHSWDRAYSITLNGRSWTGSIWKRATTHGGIEYAGLKAKPLDVPTASFWASHLDTQFLPILLELVKNELATREPSACANGWSLADRSIECRTVRHFYREGELPKPEIWLGEVPCDSP